MRGFFYGWFMQENLLPHGTSRVEKTLSPSLEHQEHRRRAGGAAIKAVNINDMRAKKSWW